MEDTAKKQKQKNEEIVNEICREFEAMASQRGNLDSHCREIAERIIPGQSTLFQTGQTGGTKGEKRNENIFDSTAAIALGRFSSILDSLLTPRNQTWHRLMPSDPALNKNREVRLWFEEANRLLFKYRYSPTANFSSQNQMNYKALGAFGTGTMFTDEIAGGGKGLRYRHCHLSQVYFSENHQGIVDKVHRRYPMSARQAVQKWGDKTPDAIKTAAKSSDPEKEFQFIHCVKPRQDYDSERLDSKGMPFVSYYVSFDTKDLMSEGGYNTFPYSVSRYEQMPGEAYGRSPAMDVLPAVKTLNEQKKTILKQGHRAVDPVLLAHDDGIVDAFSMKPGALNPGGVTADGRPLVHALPVGNISIGKELMDDERAVINDAFLVTLFQILVDGGDMTATEVMERSREKGVLLAPTVGRQQSEYLGPMIVRELDVLARQGALPPMPQALIEAKGDYRIEHDSPLSRAQHAEEASGLMRTIEMTLNVVNVTQNQEPLDHFDWDTIVPEVSDIQGVPARWMRDPRLVAQIRQGRAQQAQTQQAIQAGPAAAAMVKAAAVADKGK